MLNNVSNLSSGLRIQNINKVTEDSDTIKNSTSASSRVSSGENESTEFGGTPQVGKATASSEIVKQLKKQIEQLQKQLQQEQQALQQIQSSNQSPEAKAAAVATAQVQMAGTSAALQTVTSALLQAATAEGGSSTGSVVTTTA